MTERIRSMADEATRRLELARDAEDAAKRLWELVTKAGIYGELLPWGVEECARSLEDFARRKRYP